MSKKVTWLRSEEEILLKAVSDSKDNLNEAFMAASHMLNRSPKACQNRWYKHLRRKYKDSISFMCVAINETKATHCSTYKKPHKGLWYTIKYCWNCIISLFCI